MAFYSLDTLLIFPIFFPSSEMKKQYCDDSVGFEFTIFITVIKSIRTHKTDSCSRKNFRLIQLTRACHLSFSKRSREAMESERVGPSGF